MGFEISNKLKKVFFALIGVGVVFLVLGFFSQKKFLFVEELNEHHPNRLVVFTNADDLENYEDQLQDIQAEIKGCLGDEYEIEINDLTHEHCNHDHGSEGHEDHGHDGGEEEHAEEAHEEHAHHGPTLRWEIVISHKGHGEEGHSHEGHDHGHEGHAHDGGHGDHHGPHAVVNNNHMVAEAHHSGTPAEQVAAKIESGEIAMSDKGMRRFWSNLLVNGFFFFGIALGAIFYLALHYATESGWGVVLLRVFEGISSAMPLGMIVLLIVFIAGIAGVHHIYPWMDGDLVEHDYLIHKKSAYLNVPFFLIRVVAYFSVFYFFMRWFRKTSRREDEEGGVELHYKMYRTSATFLVFFAVFSSTMAWDFIMSIDTHWFSTLFGWYTFSGIWLSAMIMVMMVTLYLKSRGALEYVNENHIHDVGKWMFAISFLWSYLWFSQFMLIWYSNIPEETIYYDARFESYSGIFLGMFAINFVLPMVMFMSRDTKRSWPYLIVIGLIIFIGHWFDVFCMVMPGTLFDEWEFGMLEIGMFMMFLGGFMLLVFKGLASAPLVQKNHPYLQESIHHEF